MGSDYDYVSLGIIEPIIPRIIMKLINPTTRKLLH